MKLKHRLLNGDCVELLRKEKPVDCIFADPPDNIGLGYSHYKDKLSDADYIHWLECVLELFVLRANVVWFSFNAKWSFSVGRIFENLIYQYASGQGETGRKLLGKPCVQVFTFGQLNKHDLGNNHRPLWRLMWDDAPLYPDQIKVPSWRQRNGDKRAAPGGRVPGDVFDMQYGQDDGREHTVFPGDVLDFPRVTGNSAQRCDWHPTQLHEELVERCIKLSTAEGGTVLDPFGGTATTLRVCKRINRHCTLIELDSGYCKQIRKAHPDAKAA